MQCSTICRIVYITVIFPFILIHTSVVYFKKRCDHEEMQLQQVTLACNDKTPQNLPLLTPPVFWQPSIISSPSSRPDWQFSDLQKIQNNFKSAKVSVLCSLSCRAVLWVTQKGLKSHRTEAAASLLAMREAPVLRAKIPVPWLRKTLQELGLRKESSKQLPVFPVCLCQASFHQEKETGTNRGRCRHRHT